MGQAEVNTESSLSLRKVPREDSDHFEGRVCGVRSERAGQKPGLIESGRVGTLLMTVLSTLKVLTESPIHQPHLI